MDNTVNNRKNGRKILINVLNVILGGILTIVLFAILLLSTVKISFLNKSAFLRELNKSDYYAGIKTDIYNDTLAMIKPSGLTMEDVVGDSLTVDMVYNDVKGYIEAMFDGGQYEIQDGEYRAGVIENLKSYAVANGMELNDENLTYIDSMADEIMGQYESKVTFPYMSYFISIVERYNRIFWPAIGGLSLIGIVAFVMILIMQKFKHRGVRVLTYSMIAADLMLFVPICIANAKNIQSKISTSPKYFYDFVVRYVSGYFEGVMFMCGAVLVPIFICIAITIYMKKRI